MAVPHLLSTFALLVSLFTSDQRHRLSSRARISAEATEHRGSYSLCVGFSDASQSHARVRSLDHNHHTNRFQSFKECIRNVCCQTFLKLQPTREGLSQAR